MNFKLPIYVECQTCRGVGLVKGAVRSFVPCKGSHCINGYVTVLVTREEMLGVIDGSRTVEGRPGSFRVESRKPIGPWTGPGPDPLIPPDPVFGE